MVLTKNEKKELKSLRVKSKKYKIPIKRVGPANIRFSRGTTTQLGIGRATTIMNARIKIKKRKRR